MSIDVRCRIWLEKEGEPFMGDRLAAYLEAIERLGSISAAARASGVSYRTIWDAINRTEKVYGKSLILRHSGGAGGGGCRLTDHGRRLLTGYLRYRKKIRQDCISELGRLLPGLEAKELPTENS